MIVKYLGCIIGLFGFNIAFGYLAMLVSLNLVEYLLDNSLEFVGLPIVQ